MLDLKLKQKFAAKVVTMVRNINCHKWLYIVDNKFILIWKATKNQIEYLEYIKDVTPKIYILDDQYLAQDWIEQKVSINIESLTPEHFTKIHNKLQKKITTSWLKPIDDLWLSLNQEQQIYITNNLLSWQQFKKNILCIIPENGHLLHGDIHPGNLIKIKKQLFLIDWEWICIGPVEFDLAMLKQYINNDKFEVFIENYSKTIPVDIKLLYELEQLCLFRCCLWALSNSNGRLPEKSNINIDNFRSKLIKNEFSYTNNEFTMLAYASMKAIDLGALK